MEAENKIPLHVGIIMDGNRRWAKERGLIPQMGHKEGAENLKRVARACDDLGIKYLTVFAFSTENWKRSKEEVDYLMNLLLSQARAFTKAANKRNYRLQLAGDITGLSEELQEEILRIENETKENQGLTINIALNYGGRPEIVSATKQIAQEILEKKISVEDISDELLSSRMWLKNSPDPDLIIRTGGEMRLSGFLLWQSAYSEFYFTNTYWPDFDKETLEKAVTEYSNRKRNFGK